MSPIRPGCLQKEIPLEQGHLSSQHEAKSAEAACRLSEPDGRDQTNLRKGCQRTLQNSAGSDRTAILFTKRVHYLYQNHYCSLGPAPLVGCLPVAWPRSMGTVIHIICGLPTETAPRFIVFVKLMIELVMPEGPNPSSTELGK